jgi:hypothetical protein
VFTPWRTLAAKESCVQLRQVQSCILNSVFVSRPGQLIKDFMDDLFASFNAKAQRISIVSAA